MQAGPSFVYVLLVLKFMLRSSTLKNRVLFFAFFVFMLGLALFVDHAQAMPYSSTLQNSRLQNSTLPATPDGTLPNATSTPNGTIPGGTIPATNTPGGTISPTITPGGTIPLTPSPTPPIAVTPIVTGTPPGVPTPEVEPTTPSGNLPGPESVIRLSLSVNRQFASLGDVLIFTIKIDNISNGPLQELAVAVDTPANTHFVVNDSSPGWQLISNASTQMMTASAEDQIACPDGAGLGTRCGVTVPGLMQNGTAVLNYAARLDESTPFGTSQLVLKVRVTGADFQGALNAGMLIDINPEQLHYLPLFMRS